MYDVITVGSSTIDVFAKAESELIKIKTAHHEEELIAYPSGSKILIKSLDFLTGGGGTNTAVAFSKLGLKTAYVGKVGSGGNSNLIIKKLKMENVDFLGVKTKEHHAGYSIILDSIEGDRTILAYKGANNFLTYDELNLRRIKTKWFYFSSMIGKAYETLESLAEYARKNSIKVAFNPSNYLAEKGKEFLKNLLEKTDILILNKEEAELIAGKHKISEMIKLLNSYGPEQVVITDGKRGAHTIKDNKYFHVIPNSVESVETTGAGDCFASTFVAGVIKNKDVETCLRMALLNAESLIQKPGAKNGLLSYNQLLARLKKHPPVVRTTQS